MENKPHLQMEFVGWNQPGDHTFQVNSWFDANEDVMIQGVENRVSEHGDLLTIITYVKGMNLDGSQGEPVPTDQETDDNS